jgi:hypothetical protein
VKSDHLFLFVQWGFYFQVIIRANFFGKLSAYFVCFYLTFILISSRSDRLLCFLLSGSFYMWVCSKGQ